MFEHVSAFLCKFIKQKQVCFEKKIAKINLKCIFTFFKSGGIL